MMGEVGILNVGAGDTKLVFDKKNPAEQIRAGRIVRDMLRRGYALLVEVDQPDGSKAYQRALDFREDTCEYIIADFDPLAAKAPPSPIAAEPEPEEPGHEEASEAQPDRAPEVGAKAPSSRRRGRPTKRIPAASTRAVAVARSAGG